MYNYRQNKRPLQSKVTSAVNNRSLQDHRQHSNIITFTVIVSIPSFYINRQSLKKTVPEDQSLTLVLNIKQKVDAKSYEK